MLRTTCSLQHSITTTIYLGIDIITQVPQVSEYLLDLEPSVVIQITWHRDHCQDTHDGHHGEHFEEGETSCSLFGFSFIHDFLSIANSRPAASGLDLISARTHRSPPPRPVVRPDRSAPSLIARLQSHTFHCGGRDVPERQNLLPYRYLSEHIAGSGCNAGELPRHTISSCAAA